MSIRKAIPIFIFLSGAIWGKPLALGAIGLFTKAFLYFENSWSFSYRSINWHKGKLIFSDVNLNESAVSLHAKRISVFWRARHLEIERPTVVLRGAPRLRQARSSDWTVEIESGTLVLEQFGEFRFSFEKTWRNHLGRLVLEQRGSRLAAEAIEVEDEIWVDTHLHRFDAAALQRWMDLKGIINGRIHVVLGQQQCKRGSAHLDFQAGGYGQTLSRGEGTLDWEGDFAENFFTKCLETGKIRLHLSNGNVKGSKGRVEGVKGDFSFTAGVGAKWEFDGTAVAQEDQFPVAWTGKAFLHASRPRWVESEAVCFDARVAIQGSEEEGRFQWKGEGYGIDAKFGTLLQSLGSLLDGRFERFEFEQGIIDAQGELVSKDWNFALRAQNLIGRCETSSVQCRSAELQLTSQENGIFQFNGAKAQILLENGKIIEGEEWQGVGEIQNGVLIRSHFEGNIEKRAAVVVASGTLDDFRLKVSGKEGEVALKGAFEEVFGFEIEQGQFNELEFRGAGWFGFDGSFFLHFNHFDGTLPPLLSALGIAQKITGRIQSVGIGFQIEGSVASYNWLLQAKGELSNGIGFSCPYFRKQDQMFSFDVRLETPTWDLVRLYGTAESGTCKFDPSRTHFLGMPLQIDACVYDHAGLISMQLQVPISWKPLVAAAPLWCTTVNQWVSLPLDGQAIVDFAYARDSGSKVSIDSADLSWKGEPLVFQMSAVEEKGIWHIAACQKDQCTLSVDVQKEGERLHLSDGKIYWKNDMEADFFCSLDSSFQFECHLPHLRIDLAHISPFAVFAGIPLQGLEGILEGQGSILRRTHFEADFDFVPCSLKAACLDWESLDSVHFHYASDTGILCSGLNLRASHANFLALACKIELLQFESARSLWMCHHSHFHFSPSFLDLFQKRPAFLTYFSAQQEMDFVVDLECPSDLSSLSCKVPQVSLSFEGTPQHIKDLSLSFDDANVTASFLFDHQGYPIKVYTHAVLGRELAGRVVLEDEKRVLAQDVRPLSIDWTYSAETGFLIREIDGEFGGVEASFHALDSGTSLIGSARIDFEQLNHMLPPRIAQVLTDLKMGNGYELKGKLSIEKGISFRGLFSGKQIDLFGFQFRTLLAQCELGPEKVRLYDLKISDSAGMLKIDELIASAVENAPWTISIPHLTILELRPSLLQKRGKEPQLVGPLVVRELKIDDFQGLLEDSKTYTAKGELSFINSFRREWTVFDIPSDLLGRIVGLDLELLIPACGILHYELKNGYFHLTSLQNSFSEAQRSEFFLVPDPAPTMDLDGNFHILVSMKQFVLFKLTESFQILIDGKLDDPKFHLQKRRRFLGL